MIPTPGATHLISGPKLLKAARYPPPTVYRSGCAGRLKASKVVGGTPFRIPKADTAITFGSAAGNNTGGPPPLPAEHIISVPLLNAAVMRSASISEGSGPPELRFTMSHDS